MAPRSSPSWRTGSASTPGPRLDGLEGDADDTGGHDGEEAIRHRAGADGPDPHAVGHVDQGDDRREDAAPHGLSDHDIDLIEPVLEDGHTDRERYGRKE